jgi:hypothetical protein
MITVNADLPWGTQKNLPGASYAQYHDLEKSEAAVWWAQPLRRQHSPRKSIVYGTAVSFLILRIFIPVSYFAASEDSASSAVSISPHSDSEVCCSRLQRTRDGRQSSN